MAVITTDAPVDDRPVELTEDEKTAFLKAFEDTGSLRASARTINVPRNRVKVSRDRRPQFQNAIDASRARRLESAADELFWAIDAFANLAESGEAALDELINRSYDDTMDAPERPGVDLEQLAAARVRLHVAGLEWACAVVHMEGASGDHANAVRGRILPGRMPSVREQLQSLADQLGCPIAGLDPELERLLEEEGNGLRLELAIDTQGDAMSAQSNGGE